MSGHRLARLINPKSIAIIGGDAAEFTMQACCQNGFEGPVWGVNSDRKQMAGQPCFARVEDLPAVPDAVLIIVPAAATIRIVKALAKMGAGGAICFASGFSEVGDLGRARQQDLMQAAGDMALIGPNCHGILNFMNGTVLWPDQHGGERVDGGVAIVSQSGNMGINFTMQRRGLPLAQLISLGNQAVCGVEDCIEAFLEDNRITAIGMHVEGLTDLTKFIAVAEKARTAGVPLVVLKTGRSAVAASINLGHTASLAGPDKLYDALFRRLGIARVDTVEDFLESLKLLSVIGPLEGNQLSSLSCSGGEAALIADLAMTTKLEFPELSENHKSSIRATLNDYVSISNPLDYHTFIWADQDKLTACFAAMFAGGFDLSLVIVDYPRTDRCDLKDWQPLTQAVINAKRQSGKNVAVVSAMSEGLPEEIAGQLSQEGIAPLQGFAQALSAIERAYEIGQAWSLQSPSPEIRISLNDGEPINWDERKSKEWLKGGGFSVPRGKACTSVSDAVSAAKGLGFPVALKTLSSEIAHKTELGGVRLNIRTPEDAEFHAHSLLTLGKQVLVEEMIEDTVVEMIAGINRDEQFGLYMVIGFGGTLVELVDDNAVILLPADRDTIKRALVSLKMAPLFYEFRGGENADVEALVEQIWRFGELALTHQDSLIEIDINPLLVRPAGQGVTVADAFVRIIEEQT
jgi:acetate---CoA ligase (ADP-forming)